MTRLSAATVAARRGKPVDEVIGRDFMNWKPVELTVPQRHDLIDLWTTLMNDVYVHYSQKRALYGFDPIRALCALRRQIPFLDSTGFLRELTLLINRLRDQHTQLYVRAADGSLDGYAATLPFLVEVCGPYLDPTYVVTKISETLDPTFTVGVEVTSWNGVPFRRTVDLFAETLTGGRPDASRARALEVLTQRPLEFLPLPDEAWVEIGYRSEPPGATEHSIRLEWRLVAPGDTLVADDPLSARTRKGINATSEAARRARKLLFATELWQHDRTKKTPAAKAPEWLETTLPDAVSARTLRTPSGTVGYLRVWTFDVANTKQFVDEVARLLDALPRRRLIIDLRSNPGGYIETAEALLQLFTANAVQPARFACRATPTMATIAEADGNGPDLADWADSTRAAVNLGEEYSQHLAFTDPETAGQIEQRYRGRVVAIVDANTFSCGDLFTAGLVDHNIATIVAIGEATGAGGANVWDSDAVAYAFHAARQPLPELPQGVSYSIAVRRMTRTGASDGRAIEDVGVNGDEQYTMTRTDLLESNSDLIAFCGGLLARG
ncbi:MAG: hypothetical protein JWL83_4576 [Actinomycetia bacterium]|nr:hypothetical protein [Actinomycetes bacterium]